MPQFVWCCRTAVRPVSVPIFLISTGRGGCFSLTFSVLAGGQNLAGLAGRGSEAKMACSMLGEPC